jgi:hypothetical protein
MATNDIDKTPEASEARRLILESPERRPQLISGFLFFLAALVSLYISLVLILKFDTPGLVFLLGVVIGCYFFVQGYRSWRVSVQSVMQKDLRPFVLYCRPFVFDSTPRDSIFKLTISVLGSFSWLGWMIRLFRPPPSAMPQEDLFSVLIDGVGPFITIGSPQESRQSLGAHRLYCEQDEWQTAFTVLAKGARAIIANEPTTDHALWEFRTIVESGGLGKLFIVFGSDKRLSSYDKFRSATHKILPHSLPDQLGAARIVHFDLDCNPILTCPTEPYRVRMYADPVVDALYRAFLIANLPAKPQGWENRPRAFVFIGLIFGLTILTIFGIFAWLMVTH